MSQSWVLCGVAVIVLAACTRERAPSRVSSAAEAADEGPKPPQPELSRFDVPLEFDFTPVLAIVEHAVPRTFGSINTRHPLGTDRRRQYAFEATRGAFMAFVTGSDLHLRTTLSYRARGFYDPPIGPTLSAGCGESRMRPRLVVELVTPLSLSAGWHLQSAPRIGRVAPASDSAKDRCEVSVLQLDVTERVVDAARRALTAQLPQIDRRIEEIDLTQRASRWWDALNAPIRIRDDVWLELQPERLRLGRVVGARRILTIEAGMDAYPRIVTGPQPVRDRTPLPPLARDTTVSGFRVALEGRIDYGTASRAMTSALRGKVITKAGRSAVIQSVTATPASRGKLALTVRFDGDATGMLQLKGTPTYDARRLQIAVPDLDYSLDTDSKLIDSYVWLASDSLRALLRATAQVPVMPALELGRAMLTSGLNRTIGDVLSLAATVDSIAVRGVYVTRAGLVVHAGAMGSARVSIRQAPASTRRP